MFSCLVRMRCRHLSAKQTRYWNAGGNALNVETAGYALLAQLQLGRTGYAGPIVTYMTSKCFIRKTRVFSREVISSRSRS